MNAAPTRAGPVREEILFESKRHASTVRVLLHEWEDGRCTASLAFMGLRCDAPRWRYVHLQLNEIRPVAEALLSALTEPPE